MPLSKITKKIGDISNSEVSRHLSRLSEKFFIQKDPTGGRKYVLTEFGETIIKMLQPLVFLFSHENFFHTHSLKHIPFEFQTKLHALKNATLIEGTGHVMVELKEFMELPSEKVCIMVDSPFPFENTTADIDFIVPEAMKKMKPEYKNIKHTYRFKFIPVTGVCISYNDLGVGYIFFPRVNEDKTDFNFAFRVEDKEGVSLLKELWDYYWATESEYVLIDKNHKP